MTEHVFSLPMRDGNKVTDEHMVPEGSVFSLPMRDGNQRAEAINKHIAEGF